MATIDELKKIRLGKLAKLKKLGADPYPGTITRNHTIAKARRAPGKDVAVAGRLMGIRGHGKIFFLDLVDGTGKIQVVLKSDQCEKKSFGASRRVKR